LHPKVAVYQLGRGSEPMISVGSVRFAEALYMVPPALEVAEQCLPIAPIGLISVEQTTRRRR